MTTPHGSWASPITAADVAGADGRPGWTGAVGAEIWWTEPRATENGRVALVRRRADGTTETVLPTPWNVRTRVIEYGGRSWVAEQGLSGPVLVFANFRDQRLYRYEPDAGGEPVPLTPEPEFPSGMRFAEPFFHPTRDEVWCVREIFHGPGPTELRRDVVAVPLDGSGNIRSLGSSHHFLSGPRLSPDGAKLLWIGWDHPSMPWDSTVLNVADVDADGNVGSPKVLAGGIDISVAQAEWLDAENIVFVSDVSGWWNPYRVGVADGEPVALVTREEEFAGPAWQVGAKWLLPLSDGRIAMIHGRAATRLGILDPGSGVLQDVDSPYTEWAPALSVQGNSLVAVAASPTRHYDVVLVDPAKGDVEVLRPAEGDVDAAYLPEPYARTFTGDDGREIHTNMYEPRNPDHEAPPGELPPYLVFVHGGPTSRCPMVYDLEIAYFTSRGFGVVEVNYGGSTGFGREYRNRLRENWGVVDVVDCASVARTLAAEGKADPNRLAIRGGSAGGWTTAASLTAVDVYRCGTIHYPILDLSGWGDGETHDFESQYLDSIVGPWPADQERYTQRSPVTNVDRLTTPFLLMQGLEDVICPPVQAERFLARVAGRGIPHAYLTFEGEQHGFRKDSTIIAALEAELAFYGQVFGFPTPGVPPIALIE